MAPMPIRWSGLHGHSNPGPEPACRKIRFSLWRPEKAVTDRAYPMACPPDALGSVGVHRRSASAHAATLALDLFRGVTSLDEMSSVSKEFRAR